MIDEALFSKLQGLGLNQYEAKAYVALLNTGTANAYTISKVSGIPRARIYDILNTLSLRGVVMLEENSDNTKNYTALPVKVFLEQARDKWQSNFNCIAKELKAIEAQDKKKDTFVSTVRGEENILAFCRNLIRDAKKMVIVSLWDTMYQNLLPDLEECRNRGCSVHGITFNVDSPIKGLDKHRENKQHNSADRKKWFIISVDGTELLYGHSAELNGNAFYTDDVTHIYIMEDYIFHDILVNRITENVNSDHITKMISNVLSELKIEEGMKNEIIKF